MKFILILFTQTDLKFEKISKFFKDEKSSKLYS